MIGIVGGVGPNAGLDVFKKIIEESDAVKDQDHLPVILLSYPNLIGDRTEFLLGKINKNPGYAIANIINQMEKNGVTVAAIPCNTAHAEPIFNVIKDYVYKNNLKIKLLHLIEETVNFIKQKHAFAKVGILSTIGTRQTGLYKRYLEDAGLIPIELNNTNQIKLHQAIYDTTYGIKSTSPIISKKAKKDIIYCLNSLIKAEVSHVILGCTELPLAITKDYYKSVSIIDPNRVIANTLINEYRKQENI